MGRFFLCKTSPRFNASLGEFCYFFQKFCRLEKFVYLFHVPILTHQHFFESNDLIEEAGLLVGDAELAVDGSEDALYLAEGEHAAE